jgi:hypothetical protein
MAETIKKHQTKGRKKCNKLVKIKKNSNYILYVMYKKTALGAIHKPLNFHKSIIHNNIYLPKRSSTNNALEKGFEL